MDFGREPAARAPERLAVLPPFCARSRNMGAHDGGIEHLNEMRRCAHRRQRVEEGFEHARLAQPVEAFPYRVPMAEPFRQRAPANVLHREEVHRFQEQPVVRSLASALRQADPEYLQRVCPIRFVHSRRHDLSSPTQSETYESQSIPWRNPQTATCAISSTRPKIVRRQ